MTKPGPCASRMCPGFVLTKNIMNGKQELRKEIRRKKKSCPQEQLQKWSQALCDQLEQTDAFRRAETVLLYYALPDEVDTAPLIRKYASRKQILLPVVCGEELTVRRYCDEQHISTDNHFGIREPEGNDVDLTQTRIDLIVVPGMAFTAEGHRLGRGKGYYDRLLSRPELADTLRMGLCFPFQLLPELPTEAHDIRMHRVVTLDPEEDQ